MRYDPVAMSKTDVSRASDLPRLFESRTTTVTVLTCSPVWPPRTVELLATEPLPPVQPVNDVPVTPVNVTVCAPSVIVPLVGKPVVEATLIVAVGSVTAPDVVVVAV